MRPGSQGWEMERSTKGQPGLTGPQRERQQEREVEALTPGSPEGLDQVTSTHCFWQAHLLVSTASMMLHMHINIHSGYLHQYL